MWRIRKLIFFFHYKFDVISVKILYKNYMYHTIHRKQIQLHKTLVCALAIRVSQYGKAWCGLFEVEIDNRQINTKDNYQNLPINIYANTIFYIDFNIFSTLEYFGAEILTIGSILHVNGLVQERRNSSALAMELRLYCTYPSVCYLWFNTTFWWSNDVIQNGRWDLTKS